MRRHVLLTSGMLSLIALVLLTTYLTAGDEAKKVRVAGELVSYDASSRLATLRTTSGTTISFGIPVSAAAEAERLKVGQLVMAETSPSSAPTSKVPAMDQVKKGLARIEATTIGPAADQGCYCPEGQGSPTGCKTKCAGSCNKGWVCKTLVGHPYNGVCGCEQQ